MKIGIIGAGSVAQTYGKALLGVGHKVMVSSRHPDNIAGLEHEFSFEVGSIEEAAGFGDIVLLAVNYATVDEAIDRIQSLVDGKLVIDATNPVYNDEEGNLKHSIPEHAISGELMQEKLPGARVGKAFTTLWMGYVEKHAHESPRIALTYAADQQADRELISSLISDIGFAPVDLGSLAESMPLEPQSPIWNIVLTEQELVHKVDEYRNDSP